MESCALFKGTLVLKVPRVFGESTKDRSAPPDTKLLGAAAQKNLYLSKEGGETITYLFLSESGKRLSSLAILPQFALNKTTVP